MKITSFDVNNQFLINNTFSEIINEISNFLGNVNIISLSRVEFEKLNGKFLKITKEDKYGKYYNLYIPKNITKFGLLDFLININNLIGIYSEEEISKIKGTIKTLLSKAYKQDGKTLGICISNITTQKQLINNLEDTIISKSHIKNAAKLLQNTKQINILDPNKKRDIINILETTEKYIIKSFMIGIFRIGRKNTYDKMKASKKQSIEDRILGDKTYNKEELLLHKEIEIEKYQKALLDAKNKGNKILYEQIELEAANKICGTIAKYPYVYQSDLKNGYKPDFIIKKHFAQCVGFAYLCNIFFDKLGIKNNALIYDKHINLSVYIGNKSYICDPKKNPKLELSEIIKSGFNEQKVIIQNGASEIDNFAFEMDAQEGILVGVMSNFQIEVVNRMNVKYFLDKVVNLFFQVKLDTIKGIDELILLFSSLNTKYHQIFYLLFQKSEINDYNFEQGNNYLTLAVLNGPNNENYYKEKYKILKLLNKGKTAKLYKFTYNILKGKKDINAKYTGTEKEIIDCIFTSNYKKLVKILIKHEINEDKK